MMNEFDCDLLILGSGSTAFAAALRARDMGRSAVMVEHRTIGGTCVNRGCLPSKNLIEAARIVHDARHPRYPGLTSRGMEIDFTDLVRQKDEVVRAYRQKKYESLVGDSIRIENGHARFVDPHTIDIEGKTIVGRSVLIATGSRPVVPAINGLDDVPHLTSDLLASDEHMELTTLPDSLIIVGGGYIALELGQMFQRFGSQVTIVERSDQLLTHGYEPEVGKAIESVMREEGVNIALNAEVTQVRGNSGMIAVSIGTGDATRQIKGTHLLMATGRRPDTDHIAIERAGVDLNEHGAVKVDLHLRTSVEHIYAAGDVIGRETDSQMATPVGSRDGGIAAHNALADEPPRAVDHRVIPRVIFTDPQIAVVGMTEEQATSAGHSCWCNTVPMSQVPRAGAIRDTRGLIKMVADANSHQVLGVVMVGRDAGEVIHEAAMALRFGATLHDFIDLIHVYPTMAEALKIAAISRFKDPAKLSCCAD
ncbi:MAG: mercury(II) reductase [Phycisphaera sp.]|nr:mercury(II) reductase [Phycisphaera sp.]